MDLPLVVVDGRSEERLVSVDGTWDQPGLNLSHWPGNATPAGLRHDLSTGAALLFARLPREDRERMAEGCVAIANNHYDTDGVCAMFAVREPAAALQRAESLLRVAAAGDFYRVPSEEAFALDAAITGLADPVRSPWAPRFRGADDRARREIALRGIVEHLPRWLDGGIEGSLAELGDLWRPELEDLRADLAALAAAARDDVVHLDLSVWEARGGTRFAPSRHALFGSTTADRVLSIEHRPDGPTYRFLLSTLSWFDLVTRRTLPRPDLLGLADRLNQAEGTLPGGENAWRAQDPAGPSPELWFGTRDLPAFPERSPALRPSRLEPARVRREVADALRASWTFPPT